MGTAIPSFDRSTLNLLGRALADAMTHGELTSFLQACCISENGGEPKWQRMELAWAHKQAKDGCANAVVQFLSRALRPVNFINKQDDLHRYRDSVNRILAFSGLAIGEDGSPRRTSVTTTLSELNRRVNSLHGKLEQRSVHPDVLKFCRAELLDSNYFHAVLEAAKSIAEKLRQKSDLQLDGAALVDAALGGASPLLAINTLQTETERSEQKGFAKPPQRSVRNLPECYCSCAQGLLGNTRAGCAGHVFYDFLRTSTLGCRC
jgi:hypothetical protein